MLTFGTLFATAVVLVIADPEINIFKTDITPEEAQQYLNSPPFTEPQLSGRTAVLPLVRWNDPRFRTAEAGPTLGHYWKNGQEIENTDDYLEEVYKASQFHGQDGLGAYKYGYKTPESSKVENRERSGNVDGSYVFKAGSSNDLIKVRYWADSQGFHQEDNLPKQVVQETEAVKLARIAHEKAWKEAADANLHPYAYQQRQQQEQQQQYQQYNGQNQGNFGQNPYSENRESKSYNQNNAGQYNGQQSAQQQYPGQQQQYNGQQQQYNGQQQQYNGQQQQFPAQQQQFPGQQQQSPGQQQYNGQQSYTGQQKYSQQSSFGQPQNGGQQYQAAASNQYSQQVAHDQSQGNLQGSASSQHSQYSQGNLQASASTQQSQYQTSGQNYDGQQSASSQQYQSAPPPFNGVGQNQYNSQQQYNQQQNQGEDGQYHEKYQDEKSEPRGFFYSFDYPVSIITAKNEVEGGASNPGHPVDHDTVAHQ